MNCSSTIDRSTGLSMARAASRAMPTAVLRDPGFTPLSSAKCVPGSCKAAATAFILATKAFSLPASQTAR